MERAMSPVGKVGVVLAVSGCIGCGPAPRYYETAPSAVQCDSSTWQACEYASPEHSVVAVEGYVVELPSLGRKLPVLVRYPANQPGPLPVVIWSHGGELNDKGHHFGEEWGNALASHGYVTVHPAHVMPDAAQAKALCSQLGIPASECNTDTLQVPTVLRTLDVARVVDDIAGIDAWLRTEAGVSLDVNAVAVAGWSAGSQAPMLVAGAKIHATPTVLFSLPVARVRAIVALSPQGPGFSGFYESDGDSSWANVTKPVLVVTGDNDKKPQNPELLGSIRRRAYDDLPGADGRQRLMYSLLPEGVGGHGTYNLEDAASADERLTRLSAAAVSAVRAFLDAELRPNPETAVSYLDAAQPQVLADANTTEWEVR